MKKRFFLILLAAWPFVAGAQKITYLNLEGGSQWSLIKAADPGAYFEDAAVKSTLAGVTLGQEVATDLFLITGVYYQPYKEGIDLVDDRPHQSRWAAYESFLVPVRLELRIPYPGYPVSFQPRIGYVFGLMRAPEVAVTDASFLWTPDGQALVYDLQQEVIDGNFHMLEIGAGVGLRFSGFWQASLQFSYLRGFGETLQTTLAYEADGSPGSASLSSNGNGLYTSLSVGVPVSNVWNYHSRRKRARIENGAYVGKSTDREGEFYVGAEGGSLWRTFFSTSPAVGPRPMNDRGLFRYANLHTGLYAGYMFNDNLGLDLGAIYQRSSTFYALMFDHADNLVYKTAAPLYLEIPLRLRYRHKVHNHLYASLYGGASVLTHFSTGTYGTGDLPFTYTDPVGGSPATAGSSHAGTRTRQFSPVLRLGAGVEYELPLDLPLIATCHVVYLNGFLPTDDLVVTTTALATESNSISYNGSGWSLDVGVRLPLRFGKKGICEDLPEKTN
ncbi:MAG: hypothetical protein R2751_13355 [Bacteroidales bacterium]